MQMSYGWVMTDMRAVLALTIVGYASNAFAQITPAAGYTPPDATPLIKVGAVIYADYTYTLDRKTADADGNLIHCSQFNVSRSYINITGNISHIVAFRITPDIARETSATSSLNGSLEFRIKYAYAQFNLDDWTTRGSWVRLGIQQTPWVDFEENIYRYRFQGTVFSEREGFLSSSDAGASFHYNFPSNYGDVHVGVYNGENYNRVEVNDQKAIQVRAAVRPFAAAEPLFRGLRAHLFYDADRYLANADRKRFVASATLAHRHLSSLEVFRMTSKRRWRAWRASWLWRRQRLWWRKPRSTERVRPFRIRSTRSGLPSTTRSSRTFRSTISRSDPVAAFVSSPIRPSSSAPPTAR